MVLGAGAVAGGAFRAAIVVTARLRAVAALRALTAVLLTSNNAFIRFGRSTLIASGAIEVLRRSIGLLVNPVTGLLALLETGLATRRWLLYEQAVRSARVQLDLMGLQATEVNRRLAEMTSRLGRLAAREIFQAGLALSNLFSPKLGEDLQITIENMAETISDLTGIDVSVLAGAFAGLKLGGEEALQALATLKALFPGLIEEGDNLADVFEKLRLTAQSIGDSTTISNLERLAKVIESIRDRIDPILGQFADLLVLIPLTFLAGARVAIFWFLDRLRNIKDALLGLANVLGEVLGAIIRTFFDLLLGRFDDIPRAWSGAWEEVRRRIPGIMDDVLDLFTLGLNDLVKRGADKINEWIDRSIPLVMIFFGTTLPNIVKEFFGPGIGGILLNFLSNVWSWWWERILPAGVRNFITNIASMISTFFTETMPSTIVSAFSGISSAIRRVLEGPLLATINFIRDRINDLINAYNTIPLVPNIPSIPDPPPPPEPEPGDPIEAPGGGSGGKAEGGIALRATRVLVGEAGPEAIIPLSGPRAMGMLGGDQPMVVNIFIGEEKLDSILVNRLTKIAKRQGISPRSLAHL